MNEYGKLITPTTLQFERTLPGPIENVWEYLVDDEKRGLWFAGGPTELVPDGKMELVFNNSKFADIDDPTPEKYKDVGDGFKSVAIVAKVEKPNLLVINWEDGTVTFALSELGDGKIKLTLTHEKLSTERDQRIGVLAGWHTHLNILVDRLEGNQVKGFWTVHMDLEEQYGNQLN